MDEPHGKSVHLFKRLQSKSQVFLRVAFCDTLAASFMIAYNKHRHRPQSSLYKMFKDHDGFDEVSLEDLGDNFLNVIGVFRLDPGWKQLIVLYDRFNSNRTGASRHHIVVVDDLSGYRVNV